MTLKFTYLSPLPVTPNWDKSGSLEDWHWHSGGPALSVSLESGIGLEFFVEDNGHHLTFTLCLGVFCQWY